MSGNKAPEFTDSERWEDENGCHFIVSKTGESRCRCMFFYQVLRRYGTGKEAPY